MQHDLYTWEIEGNKFERLKEVTNGSKFIDKAIKDWLEEIDVKKREQVIELIFNVIKTTNIESFHEFRTNPFTNGKVLISSYKSLADESKSMITKTLTGLFKIMKDNFVEEKKNKIKEGKGKC